MFQSGQIVGGDYEILDLLGSGGMGFVFRARQKSLDRIVCLKVPREEIRADEAAMARFEREAKTIARINHPNIVSIFVVHLPKNPAETPFIVMEFIEGRELEDYIFANRGRLNVGDLLDLAKQICAGLHAAHETQIVHRDIKPANIMIATATGTVKIMDFGIARVSSLADTATSTMVVGTPAFMSPEQVRGEKPTPQSDIYALGAVLYVLFAQRPLFEGTATTVAIKQLTEMPQPPRDFNEAIPPELDRLIMKCLQKDPSKRPASAKELADELETILRPLANRPLRLLIPETTDATNALATAAQGLTWYDPSSKKRAAWMLALAAAVSILLFAGFFYQMVWAEIAPMRRAAAALARAREREDEAPPLLRAAAGDLRATLAHPLPAWLAFADRDPQAAEALSHVKGMVEKADPWRRLTDSWRDWRREMETVEPRRRRSAEEVFGPAIQIRDRWKALAPGDSELAAYEQNLSRLQALAASMLRLEEEARNGEPDQATRQLAALEPFLPEGSALSKSTRAAIAARREALRPAEPPPTPATRRGETDTGSAAVMPPEPTPILLTPTPAPTPSPLPSPSPSPTPSLDREVANTFVARLDKAILEGASAPFFSSACASEETAGRYKAFLKRLEAKYELREARHTMSDFQVEGDQGRWTGSVQLRGRLLANRLPTTIANVPVVHLTFVWRDSQWLLLDSDFPFDSVGK